MIVPQRSCSGSVTHFPARCGDMMNLGNGLWCQSRGVNVCRDILLLLSDDFSLCNKPPALCWLILPFHAWTVLSSTGIYTVEQMPRPTVRVVCAHGSTSSQEGGVGMLMHLARDIFWYTRPEFQRVAPHQITTKRIWWWWWWWWGTGFSVVSVVSAHTLRALY